MEFNYMGHYKDIFHQINGQKLYFCMTNHATNTKILFFVYDILA